MLTETAARNLLVYLALCSADYAIPRTLKSLLVLNKDLQCYTFNLPAMVTCPGATAWCKGQAIKGQGCYACKGQFEFPNTRSRIAARMLVTEDLDAFVVAMVAELNRLNGPRCTVSRRKSDGRLIVRIHSSGDFYSVAYMRAWFRIAQLCPDVVFFCYTRTWTIPEFRAEYDHAPSNLVLWCSVDPSHKDRPDWPRIAYINGTDGCGKLSCAKQLNKGEASCVTCSRCHGDCASVVTFEVH